MTKQKHMFNFFKPKNRVITNHEVLKQSPTNEIVLHLSGLHCSSCAVNIDLALEDLPGVKSTTNYAKSETKIEYDQAQTTLDAIHFTIRDLGYGIEK